MNKKKIIYILIISSILILAFCVRIYNIDTVPSGIYPDEANNGTNAYDALITGHYQWFYPDNNGREGLYLNFIALSFYIFGVSIASLKIPSILLGTLTVFGVYLLSRELFFSQPRIALIASYLTAVSFWAINFSRIGFRAILMLPILTFSFYFLLRGIRQKRMIHFIFGGLIFGLGFHTYIAFRIAPVLLVVLLVLFVIQNGSMFFREHYKNILIFIFCALFTAFPMFYTFYTHPEFLNSRTGDVSIFAQKEHSLLITLGETLTLSLGKFNFYGDQNWRHGYPPYPTLEPIVGVFFLVGVCTSILLFLLFFYKRCLYKNRNKKLVFHGFLLAWFFAFLAPEFLTTEGLPHSLRSIGVLPIVYIFAAYAMHFFIERSKNISPKTHYITIIIAIILLVWIGFFNVSKYHVHWANEPKQADAFNKDLTDIAKHIKTLPPTSTKYVIAGPLTRLPIHLLNTQTPNIIYLYEDEIHSSLFEDDFYILLPYYNTSIIEQISQERDVIIDEIATDLDTSFIIIRSFDTSL
jgi:4-amino-4-deoxy-L-arabinose transferase-like glycosyltransferase